VEGKLLWRWDVATGKGSTPGGGLEAHASAILSKAS
jgi:hypothetical protein